MMLRTEMNLKGFFELLVVNFELCGATYKRTIVREFQRKEVAEECQ